MKIYREVCVDNYEAAELSHKNGANRIELCSRLDLDGLTPNEKLIKKVVKNIKIPVRVMIRNVCETFIYKKNDIKIMADQINFCKNVGVDGVVFGCLTENQMLDIHSIDLLTEISKPLNVIIHKAIDKTPNPYESLKMILKNKKINGVLTSGGKKKAFSAVKTLKKMLALVPDDFELICAGGITYQNLPDLHSELQGKYYHGRRIINFKI